MEAPDFPTCEDQATNGVCITRSAFQAVPKMDRTDIRPSAWGAGDYEVWGEVYYDTTTGGTTGLTIVQAGITTTSATIPSVPADNSSGHVFAASLSGRRCSQPDDADSTLPSVIILDNHRPPSGALHLYEGTTYVYGKLA